MSTPLSLVKQVRKAVRCNQVNVATTQAPEESLTEEEDLVIGPDPISPKLDAKMTMLLDLTMGVQATEDQLRDKASTCVVRPPSSQADQRGAFACC